MLTKSQVRHKRLQQYPKPALDDDCDRMIVFIWFFCLTVCVVWLFPSSMFQVDSVWPNRSVSRLLVVEAAAAAEERANVRLQRFHGAALLVCGRGNPIVAIIIDISSINIIAILVGIIIQANIVVVVVVLFHQRKCQEEEEEKQQQQ